LKIFQIYFDDSHRAGLEYIPLRNDDCTVYFENSVIKQLIESGAHADSDYFGVVSYKLRAKFGFPPHQGSILGNISTRAFSPEAFEKEVRRVAPDAMSFLTLVPHDPIALADHFHPGFSHLFGRIMKAIGYDWTPTVFRDVIYFNHFVAKAAVYERYVKEMLAPAMAVMDQMPELLQNSNYPGLLPERLQARFGVPHYPFHTFLCERFFSYFAHIHQLQCAHY